MYHIDCNILISNFKFQICIICRLFTLIFTQSFFPYRMTLCFKKKWIIYHEFNFARLLCLAYSHSTLVLSLADRKNQRSPRRSLFIPSLSLTNEERNKDLKNRIEEFLR